MSELIRLIFLFLQLTFISATFQIPFRCFIWDSECLTSLCQIAIPAIANGFPDVGTKPLDPMYVPSLKIDEAGFQGDITNLTITGYRNAIVKKLSVDVAKSFVLTSLHTDLTFKGRYKSKADDTEADMLMLIKNIDINLITPFEIFKNEDNSDIMLLKSYEYTYEVKETQCYVRDLYLQTFNHAVFFDASQNWRIIPIPFGRSFMDKFVENIYNSFKTYMLSEPLRNLLEY